MSVELNEAGRAIWFRHVEQGAFRPVTRAGMGCFLLAALWLVACAALGITRFALTLDGRWFLVMFGAAGVGLAAFAITVARHR